MVQPKLAYLDESRLLGYDNCTTVTHSLPEGGKRGYKGHWCRVLPTGPNYDRCSSSVLLPEHLSPLK